MLLVIVKHTMFPDFISLHLIGHLLINSFMLSKKSLTHSKCTKLSSCSYIAYEINPVIILVGGGDFFMGDDGAF